MAWSATLAPKAANHAAKILSTLVLAHNHSHIVDQRPAGPSVHVQGIRHCW